MRNPTLHAALLAVPLCAAPAEAQEAPYSVAPGLFDTAAPDLGLKPAPGTETITIFAPGETGDRFANGAVLIAFKGRLYAQWQSSARDEDTSDTKVLFASSEDGLRWSAPAVLVSAPGGTAMRSNGGWWTDGKTLVAYVNVWPTGFRSGAGGHTEYMTSTDGIRWSASRPVTGADGKRVDGIIEQDPHRIAGGRIVNAFHMRPGVRVAPFFTDDPLGVTGWTRGRIENLPREGNFSRELEPSLFERRDGCVVMVFRDELVSFRQLASESCDRGVSWSRPALTDMIDSRAKQSAGNLPDGTAWLVNAPGTSKLRIPLAVTLSADGRRFTRAYLLRGQGDLPALSYEGQYKRLGYHYPKSIVWNGFLYVAYTANKEKVQLTRVPLGSLKP